MQSEMTIQRGITNNSICKYCASKKVKKYGLVNGIQRYFCNDCNRKFVSSETLPQMQLPIKVIAESLDMHYGGMSLNEISKNLVEHESIYISKVTLYKWKQRFTELAIQEMKNNNPVVGDTWHISISINDYVSRAGKNSVYIIDIIDKETNFLLSSKVSIKPKKDTFSTALSEAIKKAKITPKHIFTNGWKESMKHWEIKFGFNNQLNFLLNDDKQHESWLNITQKTFEQRTKGIHRLKSFESILKYAKGWAICYNYFRTNICINMTPAQMAGVNLVCHDWEELLRKKGYHHSMFNDNDLTSVIDHTRELVLT